MIDNSLEMILVARALWNQLPRLQPPDALLQKTVKHVDTIIETFQAPK